MTPVNVTFSLISLTGRINLLIFSLLLLYAPQVLAQADPHNFPEYKSISPNVAFWEKVYSTYSVNTSIIHDQLNLGRIYTTVSLVGSHIPGARQINNKRTKRVKQHIQSLLVKLSKNQRPTTNEEKKLAALFTNPSAAAYKRAATNIRAQTGLRERFREGVVRSGAYMTEIKRIFRSFGLPEDLAYLPHVESSFNPKAFSKFGAAGMWQFTHTTGKEFLTINYIIDERRDPLISARAAAQFLKRNYQQLGTWPLALTAYNYGPSGMKRAVKQEGSYENIFRNYQKGHFKFASRNFYSEFLAAVNAAKKLERSGLTQDKPLKAVSAKLPAYAKTNQLCTYLGISIGTLRNYNPALRDPVFKGTKFIPKNYMLKLPYRFNNSSLLAAAPSSIFSPEQKRSKFYQVRSGDSAGTIAQAHNVSLKSLIQANNLNSQAVIRVGQNLRIPTSASITDDIQLADRSTSQPILKDQKKHSVSGKKSTFEPDFAVAGNLKVSGKNRTNNLLTGRIVVQPDESVRLLADWLKVTPSSIRLSNNLSLSTDIYPGQNIVLDFLNTGIEAFEENRFDFHQELQEDFFNSYAVVGVTNYRVKEGDTLWEICRKKFDIPLWLLKKYNDNLNYSHLVLASTLQVPVLQEI